MTQMKLIANSRDEWTVKELVETLHIKVNDLERKLDAMHDYNKARFEAMQSMLHAIVLRITDPGAALYTHVLAMEPTVVPNEDEAMPVVEPMTVLASCPQCDTKAYTEAGIADFFGWRKMEDGKTIRQSWCRECRSSGKDKTEVMPVVEPVIVQAKPRTKKSPTNWSDMCPKAAAFAAAVTAAKNAIPPLQYRLDHDKLTQSERADLQRRVDNFVTKGAAAKKQYNIRIKELGYVHPPSKSKAAK